MTGVGFQYDGPWFESRHHPTELLDRELLEELVENTRRILRNTDNLPREEEQVMADITALQAQVASVVAGETAAETALGDLATQIQNLVANNPQIPQADIDALTSSLAASQTALANAVSTDDPAPVTPPTPAPGA